MNPTPTNAVAVLTAHRARHAELLAVELAHPADDHTTHRENLARHRAAIHAYTVALAVTRTSEHPVPGMAFHTGNRPHR